MSIRSHFHYWLVCILLIISSNSTADQTLVYSIQAPHNDAEELLSYGRGHGSMDVYAPMLKLGKANRQKRLTGLRFTQIKVPKGTPILNAYIQFTAGQTDEIDVPSVINIAAEDTANSAFFSVFWNDLSRRDRTSNRVTWQTETPWQIYHERNELQRTPDLKDLIQEVVNRHDWKPGNALSFLLEGESVHHIESFEGSHRDMGVNDLAAQLVIKIPSRETFTIKASHDDAEEHIATGHVDTGSSDLELGQEKSNAISQQRIGLRFTDISIPAGAQIRSAYIQFAQDENKNHNPFDVTLFGEQTTDALPFSEQPGNLSKRALTSNSARWNKTPDWFWLNQSGPDQRSPDVANIVQEIIDQPDWKAGNSLAFLIDGQGTRTAESFDGRPDLAPKLVVEFIGQNQKAVFDKIRLAWNQSPDSTMTIIWDQLRGTQGVVYYDEYQGNCPTEQDQYRYKQVHHRQNQDYDMHNVITRLSNLKPDTDYRFIIVNGDGVSQCNWFRTAPSTPKPFSYISGGDTKSSGNALQAGRWSNRMVAKVRPLFVFFTGDFNSGLGLNADSWKQWLTDWSTLTRSEDGRMYPLVVVHGNHEDGDFGVLYKLFDAGNPDPNEPRHFTYNALSFGGDLLRLFSLNTELYINFRIIAHHRQKDWFERMLQESQHYTFRIAGYHKPMRPHSRKKLENDYLVRDWAPLMDNYDVHIAYESDTHNHVFTYPIRLAYQGESGSDMGFVRDDEHGTLHVGEGSWGATPRDDDDKKSWTLNSGSFNQIKLNRVYPASKTEPARIDISVIKTAQYINGKLVNYVKGVSERPKNDPMALPGGAVLHSVPLYGDKISYPFKAMTGQ